MKKLFLVTAMLSIMGCTTSQNHPSVVDGSTCPVQKGTVLDVQRVTIERNTEVAQTVGAGLGGYVANKATDSKGEVTQVLATAVGVAAGAVVADRVADATQDLSGVELIVELDRGTVSVTQQRTQYNFGPGDAVWVVGYPDSRVYSRTNCRGQNVRIFPVKGTQK